MANGQYARGSTLGTSSTCIAQNIDDPGNGPGSASGGSGDGEVQAGDEKGTKERGLVLNEVGVSPLGWRRRPVSTSCRLMQPSWENDDRAAHTTIESVCGRVLVGLLLAGIRSGVLYAACLASLVGQALVEGVDEEGRCGRGEDEA